MVDNLHLTRYSIDSEGSNMLHITVKHKSDMRYSITKRFPELLSTIDIYGHIPLYFVCDNNDIDYVKWLFDLVLMEMKPKRQVPSTPIDNLENALPSRLLVPVSYHQHVKNMKLYAVDTEGENILHVMVKKNYYQLLDYILNTYPQLGCNPAQRDFWIRAENVSSPIEEAITRGLAECLDILLKTVINYLDPTVMRHY